MIAQSLRAARPLMARIAVQSARRTIFTPSAVRSADLVQDIYLREIKNYKQPTINVAKDSEGHVQKFSVPATPKSPEETDLANDLKSYETQQVEVEGAASSDGADSAMVEEDWFEPEEEAAPSAAH
ncbi:uncharacterized protein PV09_01220 [Verruconis gallopava]|uniref:Uncharacterized protein n=1 Tax=Verruconis gallopava TaxID=253628 RepID=A0A0D1Z5Q6_9PEZI|nr:uncharacterized protein PV09_01220 [Verruconis gallopava]KIW08302.1 hypothetical protein PV09_01220 [Verruconis gallopava]